MGVRKRRLPDEVLERVLARFDHRSPEVATDPFGVYAKLRERCPLHRSEAYGGFWVVANHRLVDEVAHDDARFCVGQGQSLPHAGNPRPFIPLEIDPPDTLPWRHLLGPLFSPTAVEQREAEVRAIARDLVDQFVARGRCDVVSEFAEPLPARETMRLVGLPEERWRECLHAIHVGVHESARDLDKSVEAMIEVAVLLAETMEAREEEPADDAISFLQAAEFQGRPVTEEEILDICLLLLFGGLDTTASVIGFGLGHLAGLPEERKQLVAQPERIPLAMEEFLRFYAPVQGLARTATGDTMLDGQVIHEGDKLWVLWASANHDEAEFRESERIILDRSPNRHFAFGVGIHRCLGSNLGRLMARVAFEEFLTRIPDYRLESDEFDVIEDAGIVYALTTLPVVFEPQPDRRPEPALTGGPR
ncbi:MAG: cytochrome P450 [Acidimicrobiia bacterium]